MQRVPEPEIMDGSAQSEAYAQADFSEVNAGFVADLLAWAEGALGLSARRAATVVDLGCGPADICVRLAGERPGWRVYGLDGSAEMLGQGRAAADAAGVSLHLTHLPALPQLPLADLVMSNSLLHHLADPLVLWRTAKALAPQGAGLYVMDLRRPASEAAAQAIVDTYAADEPEVLRHDFFHSLKAAYRPAEVQAQLRACGLRCEVAAIGDRHLLVHGRI